MVYNKSLKQQWISTDYEMNYNQASLSEKQKLNYRKNQYWTDKIMV